MNPEIEDKIEHARQLGSVDRYACRPMRDMQAGDSAWLMDQVGETKPTTEANAPARWQICEAYEDGWSDAADAIGQDWTEMGPEAFDADPAMVQGALFARANDELGTPPMF